MSRHAERLAINYTFRPERLDGFVAICNTANDVKPPYIIANVALHRVRQGMLELPESYDVEGLRDLMLEFDRSDIPQKIDLEKGRNLRDIGHQLLKLDDLLEVVPPLTQGERFSIERLVHVVTVTDRTIEFSA